MAYIQKLRGRGVSGVVTAYGEVLFMPGGQVYNWTNRFAARVGAEARRAAPTNKRPRWAHYGKPLKATITASRPEFRPTRAGARVYAAVGSKSPHAYYVDQGTGVYGGNGPYEAKILPPWTRGGASLYEHTWRPTGPGGRKVKKVMIKGQKGQGFFDAGLRRGFARMRMRSFQVPGEGVKGLTDAMGSFPRGLEFAGNTVADAGFIAQLQEWRAWRDEAWDAGKYLGENRGDKPDIPYANSSATSVKNKNINDYLQSVNYAKKRKGETDAAYLARIERKRIKRELAKAKQAEIDRKTRIIRGNVKAKSDATAYYLSILAKHPDATFRATGRLADGTIAYQVSYVTKKGNTKRRQFRYAV